MSTHFSLRANSALASIFALTLLALCWSAGTAHADSYNGFNLYPVSGFSSASDSVWFWNAQSGLGMPVCDGDFDIEDSSCIMTPGYHGFGGGGYAQSDPPAASSQMLGSDGSFLSSNMWNSSIFFGNPLLW